MSRFDIGDLVSPAVKLCSVKRTAEMKFTLNMMTKVRGEGRQCIAFIRRRGGNPFAKVLMSLMG